MRWLKNPTQADTEFQYGGGVFMVGADETKGFADEVVKHYINHIQGPLVEVAGGVGVRITNNTNEEKAFQGITIKPEEVIELPKNQAKAFIRAVPGVFWATDDSKKKSTEVADEVGEKGPEHK